MTAITAVLFAAWLVLAVARTVARRRYRWRIADGLELAAVVVAGMFAASVLASWIGAA